SHTGHALPEGFGQTRLRMPQRRLIQVTETGDEVLLLDAVELSQLWTTHIGQLDQTSIPGQVERVHNITPRPRPVGSLFSNLCHPSLHKRLAQLIEAHYLVQLIKLITPAPQPSMEQMQRLTQQIACRVALTQLKLLKDLQQAHAQSFSCLLN